MDYWYPGWPITSLSYSQLTGVLCGFPDLGDMLFLTFVAAHRAHIFEHSKVS